MPDDMRPPLTTTTSIKPAMSVLAVALFVLALFGILDVATSSPPEPSVAPLVVGGLSVAATTNLLSACSPGGIPPSNIAAGLIVPFATAGIGAGVITRRDPGAYDCSQTLHAPHRAAKILGFYRSNLLARGWGLFSTAASVGPHHRAQLLFQKAGTDGFFWIEGITITNQSVGHASWTVEIYQASSIN